MFIAGERVDGSARMEVRNGLTGSVVGEIAIGQEADIERALAAAEGAAVSMRRLSAAERAAALERAAVLIEGATDELARLITLEEGKPITEARSEAGRIPLIFRLAAADLARPQGETLSVDAAPGAGDRLGLTLRQPCGVVLAITPFNYPLILVAHKVAPALAAGNAVILKPASHAALTALRMVELLLDCGLPPGALQCVTGPGDQVGMRLAADRRVRKISFTGSTSVGEAITRVAGVKKLSLELGGNAPVVVLADADLGHAARVIAVGGYINAGQACISPQRIIVERTVMADFLDALVPSVGAIRVGDPLELDTQLAGMVTEAEARRVERMIDDAVAEGGRVLTGGQRDGAIVQPTVVADVTPSMAISRDELFGPAVGVTGVDGLDEALALANDTPYGLSAAIFTRDLDAALRFARGVDSGNIMINWHALWRADLMPYGGLKMSGFGKEGPHYAIEEMTESKTVVFHGIRGVTDLDPVPSTGALVEFVAAILQAAGAPPASAMRVAQGLIDSDVNGVASHGLRVLPRYLEAIDAGELDPAGQPAIVKDGGASVLVSGGWTFGHVAADRATSLAIERALGHGLSFVGLIESHHIGRLGEYVERAAREGVILAMWNGGQGAERPIAAPFGGRSAVMHTNPIAIGAPGPAGDSMLLDIATSSVAGSKIDMARERGETVPPGLLLDDAGDPTTDPAAYFTGGALLPFGGHKGFGFMLTAEILGRIVLGADDVVASGSLGGPVLRRSGTAFTAWRADLFVQREVVEARAGDLFARIRSVSPQAGFDRVRVPGDLEREARERTRSRGLALDRTTRAALRELGQRWGAGVPDGL